jgi:hypothetical protein
LRVLWAGAYLAEIIGVVLIALDLFGAFGLGLTAGGLGVLLVLCGVIFSGSRGCLLGGTHEGS